MDRLDPNTSMRVPPWQCTLSDLLYQDADRRRARQQWAEKKVEKEAQDKRRERKMCARSELLMWKKLHRDLKRSFEKCQLAYGGEEFVGSKLPVECVASCFQHLGLFLGSADTHDGAPQSVRGASARTQALHEERREAEQALADKLVLLLCPYSTDEDDAKRHFIEFEQMYEFCSMILLQRARIPKARRTSHPIGDAHTVAFKSGFLPPSTAPQSPLWSLASAFALLLPNRMWIRQSGGRPDAPDENCTANDHSPGDFRKPSDGTVNSKSPRRSGGNRPPPPNQISHYSEMPSSLPYWPPQSDPLSVPVPAANWTGPMNGFHQSAAGACNFNQSAAGACSFNQSDAGSCSFNQPDAGACSFNQSSPPEFHSQHFSPSRWGPGGWYPNQVPQISEPADPNSENPHLRTRAAGLDSQTNRQGRDTHPEDAEWRERPSTAAECRRGRPIDPGGALTARPSTSVEISTRKSVGRSGTRHSSSDPTRAMTARGGDPSRRDVDQRARGGVRQQTRGGAGVSRHLQLYYEGVKRTKEAQECLLMKKEALIQNELKHCTFTPRLISSNFSDRGKIKSLESRGPAPRGFWQAVERQRNAASVRELVRQEIERIPAGENYERLRSQGVRPFSFDDGTKTRARKEALLYVDVCIGPSKNGRIGIHEGDDLRELANNFGRAYQLDGDARERLHSSLVYHMTSLKGDSSNAKNAHRPLQEIQQTTADSPSFTASGTTR